LLNRFADGKEQSDEGKRFEQGCTRKNKNTKDPTKTSFLTIKI